MDNKKKDILKSLAGSASTKIDLNKVRDEWKYNDNFDEMIKVGGEFKENLGLSDDEVYLTLNQIREKNKTATSLLDSEIQSQEYSEELVEQCKNEFDAFVKPIRDEVISRYIDDFTKKYNQALKI